MRLSSTIRPLWLFQLYWLLPGLVAQLLNTPTFDTSQATTQEDVLRTYTAFTDMITLATTVAVIFDPCAPAFIHYFQPGDADFVQSIFRKIANIPLGVDISGISLLSIFDQQLLTGFDPNMQRLLISFGDSATYPGPQGCSANPALNGYFEDNGVEWICLCPSAFVRYPDRAEIENPPDWAYGPDGQPLPGFGCDGLGDHDTDLMRFPGATLLHEILHDSNFFNDLPGWDANINIRPGTALRQIIDYTGSQPTDGYGPFGARILNFIATFNPRNYPPHVSLNNADSYVSYALSSYWSWKCAKTFNVATSINDDAVRSVIIPPRPAAGVPLVPP